MSQWTEIRLGDVANVMNGKTPSTNQHRVEGHPVLKIRDIDLFGKFRGSFDSFIDKALADKYPERQAQDGDTLILNAAHNSAYVASKVYRVESAVIGAHITGEWLIVRPHAAALDSSFLKHWIGSMPMRSRLRDLVKGIHLYPKDVAALKLPLPPQNEQRRVAEVLDRADALRTKRREALTCLDEFTQSVFLGMFGRGDEFPIVSLSDLLSFVTSGGRGWAKYYAPTGSRFIRSLDVRMNKIGTDDAVYVKAPNNAEAKRTKVSEGDVLLTITGSLIGRVSAVSADLSGSYVSQHVAILRPIPDKVVPEFLSFYLSLPSGGQKQIANKQYGQTKPGLNFDQIRDFTIPDVPLTRQREFLKVVAKVQSLKSLHECQLACIEDQFASLQHRAFRGEL